MICVVYYSLSLYSAAQKLMQSAASVWQRLKVEHWHSRAMENEQMRCAIGEDFNIFNLPYASLEIKRWLLMSSVELKTYFIPHRPALNVHANTLIYCTFVLTIKWNAIFDVKLSVGGRISIVSKTDGMRLSDWSS